MEVWKIIFLFQGCILRFHVNLPGCTARFVSNQVIHKRYPTGEGHRHLLQEPQGQLHLLLRQRSAKVTRSGWSPGDPIDMAMWAEMVKSGGLACCSFCWRFCYMGVFFLCRRMFRLSMVIQYHRKKCGGFALGFRGDVVGYPASSLGRRFCPHTFLLVSRTGPCSLWKVIFKLYITATLVQSLGYSPETRKCVWNPSICPFVTSTPISFSTAYISHRKGPFTHSIIESWINSGVRI